MPSALTGLGPLPCSAADQYMVVSCVVDALAYENLTTAAQFGRTTIAATQFLLANWQLIQPLHAGLSVKALGPWRQAAHGSGGLGGVERCAGR